MGNKKRNISLPFPQYIPLSIVVLTCKKRNNSLPKTNGQQEAKYFASIPTIHTIEYCCVDVQEGNISLPKANGQRRSERFRFHSHNIYYCCVDRKRSETSRFHTVIWCGYRRECALMTNHVSTFSPCVPF